MKITKFLAMALAVVVCTTTSANTFLPGAKASAYRTASLLLRASSVAFSCPHTTCMISALSEYAGCLANAQTAYSSCIETCTGRSLPLKNACVRKCSKDNQKDVAKCESNFEDASDACGDPPDGKP